LLSSEGLTFTVKIYYFRFVPKLSGAEDE